MSKTNLLFLTLLILASILFSSFLSSVHTKARQNESRNSRNDSIEFSPQGTQKSAIHIEQSTSRIHIDQSTSNVRKLYAGEAASADLIEDDKAGWLDITVLDHDRRPVKGARIKLAGGGRYSVAQTNSIYYFAPLTDEKGKSLVKLNTTKIRERRWGALRVHVTRDGFVEDYEGSSSIYGVKLPEVGEVIPLSFYLLPARKVIIKLERVDNDTDEPSTLKLAGRVWSNKELLWQERAKFVGNWQFEIPAAPIDEFELEVSDRRGKYETYKTRIPQGTVGEVLNLTIALVRGDKYPVPSAVRLLVSGRPKNPHNEDCLAVSAENGDKENITIGGLQESMIVEPGAWIFVYFADTKERESYYALKNYIVGEDQKIELKLTARRGTKTYFELVDEQTGNQPSVQDVKSLYLDVKWVITEKEAIQVISEKISWLTKSGEMRFWLELPPGKCRIETRSPRDSLTEKQSPYESAPLELNGSAGGTHRILLKRVK